MPFTISYSNEVKAEFRASPAWDIVMIRGLIGSFEHDRRLNGKPIDRTSSPGAELMQLSNNHITLHYELNRDAEQVRIVAIVRD